MAVFAVHVGKTVPWRGAPAPVGNTYHYKTDTGEPFDDAGAIAKIVEEEKKIFATNVAYTTARTWGPTDGDPNLNKMREVVQLSGSGLAIPSSMIYPEIAVMCYWPLGRYGSRNRPQYLRKWLHLMRYTNLPNDGARAGNPQEPGLVAYMAAIERLAVLGLGFDYTLCTASGDHEAPVGGGRVYPFLEHRQIGQ